MDFYANKYMIHNFLLLYFNNIESSCILYSPKYSMSGILFLQFYRMCRSTIKDNLKYYTSKLYTLNPKIQEVSGLNDG